MVQVVQSRGTLYTVQLVNLKLSKRPYHLYGCTAKGQVRKLGFLITRSWVSAHFLHHVVLIIFQILKSLVFFLYLNPQCLLRSWVYTAQECTGVEIVNWQRQMFLWIWWWPSWKKYWCSVKLLSVALTSLFLLSNTMKCLQHCITHVYKDTATSSSISETNPPPVCNAFSVLTVSSKAEVSAFWFCLQVGILGFQITDQEKVFH